MSIDLERFPWSDSANRMLTYVTKGWYDKSYTSTMKNLNDTSLSVQSSLCIQ